MLLHIICDTLTVAASLHVLLKGNDRVMVFRKAVNDIGVHRFDEAPVHQRTPVAQASEFFPDMFRGADHTSDSHESNTAILINHFTLAVLDLGQMVRKSVVGNASRISYGDRTIKTQSVSEHFPEFPFVLGSQDSHIRDRGHVCEIQNSLMGLTVAADEACPVNTENDRQVLQTYVHHDLVKCPLHER